MIDVGDDLDPSLWAELPEHDRIMVGGRTVWLEVQEPVLVTQPNRWGVIEEDFPPVPCVVESDPLVTGCLPLPSHVVGFVDRGHRPIEAPRSTRRGENLMETARRFAGSLTQVRGVSVAAAPFARTIPLLTPLEAADVVEACATNGIVGLRPLIGLAGGVAMSVHSRHDPSDLEQVAKTMRQVVTGRLAG